MVDEQEAPARSYGCSLGCGNPYDFVVVSVQDGEAQMLCVPCFVRTAMDMVGAILNPDDPEIARRIAEAGTVEQPPMSGRQVARRGHEAPADTIDPDAIDRFESFVLADEVDDVLGG